MSHAAWIDGGWSLVVGELQPVQRADVLLQLVPRPQRLFDTPAGDGIVVPEQVSVGMAEIADSMREGLLALAVGADLLVPATVI